MKSGLGKVFCGMYLALFLLSGAYAVYRLVYHTATSELCGVPAILVTQPWSSLTFALERGLGVGVWYERFSGHPALYGLCAMLTLLPAAAVNAWLFYRLGALISAGGDSR